MPCWIIESNKLEWHNQHAQAVDELLLVAGADGSMPVPTPSWHYAEDEEEGGQPVAPPSAAGPGTMTLREALLKCYDLRWARVLQAGVLPALPCPSLAPPPKGKDKERRRR